MRGLAGSRGAQVRIIFESPKNLLTFLGKALFFPLLYPELPNKYLLFLAFCLARHLHEATVALSGTLLCGACQSSRCPLAQSAVPLVCRGEENQVFPESITHFFSAGVRPRDQILVLGPGPEVKYLLET